MRKPFGRSRRKRQRWDIYAGLLTTALKPAGKTRLQYNNNTSYGELMKHLDALLEMRLLEVVAVNPHTQYQTTERGRKWLCLYNKLASLSGDRER